MAVTFNPFTGNLDFVGAGAAVPDPLTVNNLTVNTLLTAAHIHGSLAGNVYIHVKNLDVAPLEKGTPFYISGTVGSSDRVEIKRADADGPGTGPAIGLVESTLAVNGEGNGIIIGEIYNYDTATPGWATNDALYVSTTGTLTNVRPTTGYRQIVGHVGRVHASTGTIVTSVGKKEPVAGSNTQIQFNDDGGFGGSADLTFDKITKQLTNKGDISLDDGGTYTTTVQCVTPTANRTISLPDATGTVGLVGGSSGQLVWNNAGAYAGASTLTYDGSILTTSGRFINSYNATASSPAKVFTGTWFTGGTATTTKPQVLIEPAGTTSTAWSTSGTGFGINAPSGFNGNLLDLQVNGTSLARINQVGTLILAADLRVSSSSGIGDGATFTISTFAGSTYFSTNNLVLRSFAGANPVNLTTDASNIFAQRNGTSAQTYRCYGTYTDASNYVRAALSATSTAVTLAAETAGTGADNIPLNLTAAGIETVKINSVAEVASSSTVAGLPVSPRVGMIARVTNAKDAAVGSAVTGGGSAAALVWYNGAAWNVLGV